MSENADSTVSVIEHGYEKLKITKIRVPGLSAYLYRLSCFVAVEIDGVTRRTEVKKSGFRGLGEWTDVLEFAVALPSVMNVQVFRVRAEGTIALGTCSIPIETKTIHLCGNLRDNSAKATARVIDIELTLSKDPLKDYIFTHETAEPSRMLGIIDSAGTAVKKLQNLGELISPLMSKVEAFSDLVHDLAEIHPYAKMAVKILGSVYTLFKRQIARNAQIATLLENMISLYDAILVPHEKVKDHYQLHPDLYSCIVAQTVECCYFVNNYATRGFGKNMIAGISSKMDKQISDYLAALDNLKEKFTTNAVVSTHVIVCHVLDTLNDLDREIHFMDMAWARGADLGPSKSCLSGTREMVLDQICDWINAEGEDSQRIMFLYGVAGAGKSTIAHSIAQRYRKLVRLGASFAFDRSRTDRTADTLFPTIAQNLADFDKVYARMLDEVVGSNKALRTTTDLRQQFGSFLVEPSRKCTFTGPIVIVIDGLDECPAASTLAEILVSRSHELPPNFRVLITARLDTRIFRIFKQSDAVRMEDMHATPEETVHEDILRFILAKLHDCVVQMPHRLDEELLTQGDCESLAKACQGLFQYAAVACERLLNPPPSWTRRDCLRDLVDSSTGVEKPKVLDTLYISILQQLYDPITNTLGHERVKRVLALVLAAKTPLSMNSLQHFHLALYPTERYRVQDVLAPLGSLVYGTTDPDKPIHILHSSFRDFLADESRSHVFYVGSARAHSDMALSSLEIMNNLLRFNIAQLPTSYTFNSDIEELQAPGHLSFYVPIQLTYACQHWAVHLTECGANGLRSVHGDALRLFLHENFLFWLEVVSLHGLLSYVFHSLKGLVDGWSTVDESDAISPLILETRPFLLDAQDFMNTFGAVISTSVPHIYLSALPRVRPESCLRIYQDRLSHSLRSYEQDPLPALQYAPDGESGSIEGVDDATPETLPSGQRFSDVVVVSPCRLYVAVQHDGKIHIYTTEDLELRTTIDMARNIFQPGRTSEVLDLAFTVDSVHLTALVKTSRSKKRYRYHIHVWDVNTGEAIALSVLDTEDQMGCTAQEIHLLKYSSNGKWVLASVGDDTKSLRVWKVPQYKEFPEYVLVRADRKPDNRWGYLVRRRYLTIRKGHKMFHQLDLAEETHNIPVKPKVVASSLDGTLVSLGFSTGTVAIWQVASAALHDNPDAICTPTMGFECELSFGGVDAIAFSSDKHVVAVGYSNSADGETESIRSTIALWSIETGQMIANILMTLGALSDKVDLLTFSYDARRLIHVFKNTVNVYSLDSTAHPTIASTFEATHSGCRVNFASSVDGIHILTADSHQTKLWVWCTTGFLSNVPNEKDGASMVLERHYGAHESVNTVVRFFVADPAGNLAVESVSPHDLSEVIYRTTTPLRERVQTARRFTMARLNRASWKEYPKFFLNGYALHGEACELWCEAVESTIDRTFINSQPYIDSTGLGVGWSCRIRPNALRACAVSPDGERIAALVANSNKSRKSARRTYDVHVWSSQTGLHLCRPFAVGIARDQGLVFSPDGRHLAVYDVSAITLCSLWGPSAGPSEVLHPNIKAPTAQHSQPILSVALWPSTDGIRVAVGFGGDVVRIWRWRGGEGQTWSPIGPVMRRKGAITPSGICSLAYSPNGEYLASASFDGVIRVWDVSSRNEKTYTTSDPTILFSQDPADALLSPRNLLGKATKPVQEIVLRQDGWVRVVVDNEEKLLFWIPPEQRRHVVHPMLKWTNALPFVVNFDLRNFRHGSEWTNCYSG
ncbi:hypothetical protein NM688_g4800 [Phlebia brevispora]|uniref:Uncharacterized protein n=1 Tax=Phlebia brevispora TaxID=194682 RepID=A0ACC1T267_9APHY|nr:hypothetical protein NM688_g4800 [Phlebia brevispora]